MVIVLIMGLVQGIEIQSYENVWYYFQHSPIKAAQQSPMIGVANHSDMLDCYKISGSYSPDIENQNEQVCYNNLQMSAGHTNTIHRFINNKMVINMQDILIPSDNLAHLRKLISGNPQLTAMIGIPLQIRLVIDTNCVLEELLWLAGKRQKPFARTNLQEAIDSETVIAFAPEKLRTEVERYLPRLANKYGISENRLWDEWQAYQTYLRFHNVDIITPDIDYPIVDPDDLPFISLSHQVGALAIVSRDHHIAMMGGKPVNREIATQLRDYARAKSIELTIKLGAYSITFIVTTSMSIIVKLVVTLIRSFLELPPLLQLVLLSGMAIVVVHPHNSNIAIELCGKMLHNFKAILPEIDPIFKRLRTESTNSTDALKHIQQTLSQTHRIPLRIIAFSVCLAAREPLSLKELARRVLASGYTSQSSYFEVYLHRVIRSSPHFVREIDGRWTVKQPQTQDHRK
ncbi:MAG: PIN domain-containing protein [Blastochloris sp.]|nr:PIN domain-containing protein [Blastochloris sp.]